MLVSRKKRKNRRGGPRGYWNYLGCEKQKITGNVSEGSADSRVQSAGSHSEPDEYGIFCKRTIREIRKNRSSITVDLRSDQRCFLHFLRVQCSDFLLKNLFKYYQ